jgi:hypothetical protein
LVQFDLIFLQNQTMFIATNDKTSRLS